MPRAQLKNCLLIAALPLAMVGLWLATIASGNGQLDSLGNPVGSDFAMFYLAGQTASLGEWSQLYNETDQQRRLVALFPGLPLDTYLPYRYPPLLAWLLAPLGMLPYRTAHFLFVCISLAAYSLVWHALSKRFLNSQREPLVNLLLTGLIVSPILAQTLIDGQASCLWFAVAAATWLAIDRRRFVLAGICLALAACKPNVMLLLGVVWVVRYPRMLLGIIPAGLVMLTVTLSVAGWECLHQYIELAKRLATDTWSVETPYWKVQSLLSWTELLCGAAARQVNLTIGLSLAISVGLWWRRAAARVPCSRPIDNLPEHTWINARALSAGLLVNMLFNPYTPVYDLLLLSLGMFTWLVWAAEHQNLSNWFAQRDIKIACLCLWIGPVLSQSLSRELSCPQQFMPLCLVLLVVVQITHSVRQKIGPGYPPSFVTS